jgi:uncharacterized membrane protein YfcA
VIDHRLAISLLVTAIPAAAAGAWLSGRIEERILRAILGVGLFGVAANAIRGLAPETRRAIDAATAQADRQDAGQTCLVTADGEELG